MASRAYKEAHRPCLEILQRDQGEARAWFLLGILAADHDNPVRASELFERAAILDPSAARHHAGLARALVPLNRHGEALAAARRAAALQPVDAHTVDTLGVVFSRLGRHAEALPYFERSAARDPGNASFQYNLAVSLQFSGRFAEAEAAYRRVLDLQPDNHQAWSGLAQLRRQTPDDDLIERLTPLFEQTRDPERRLHFGHAIAKAHEDLGRYPEALDWLIRAKAGKRAELAYDPADDAAIFEAAAATTKGGGEGFASDAPIFVVGLPRTGTTLVDRILSSHPDVVSAGELTAFALLVKRAAGTPSNLVLDPETLRAATNLDLAAVGEAYVAEARPPRDAPRFVDKMPLNVIYAGLIHRALPNARIVCLRRDPMDACLANFRQLFATGFTYYGYAYDLADTARYYLAFDRLVGRWREALPADRFTEIAYEDIVADQEGQTRRLLDFCGLSWDPRCLSFHENDAPVATASSVQVRSPIYATSIGRWRRYGEGLAPLKAALKASIRSSPGS